MSWQTIGRGILAVLGAAVLLLPTAFVQAAPQHFERHFAVKGRPVIVLQNVANGRIEVKSSKNPEVIVSATQASNKIGIETEQAGERVDITATVLDNSAPANEHSGRDIDRKSTRLDSSHAHISYALFCLYNKK